MTVGNALAIRYHGSAWGSGNPANLQIRLYEVLPNRRTGAGGVLVSGAGYSNQAIANNTVNFPAPVTLPGGTGVVQRIAAEINFGTPGVVWEAAGWAIFAGSDIWYSLEFDAPITFAVGRPARIEANSISFELDPEDLVDD